MWSPSSSTTKHRRFFQLFFYVFLPLKFPSMTKISCPLMPARLIYLSSLVKHVEKTEIMIFRKGGVLNRLDKWFYAGNEIEIVNSFNYLDVLFSSGGSLNNTTKTTADKGLRAFMSLFNITRGLKIHISIMHNLFDTSVLNYGCEIRGYIKAENVEKVHRKFCKQLLAVKNSTNNLTVY